MYKNKLALSVALASSLFVANPAAFAHGGSAEYMPVSKALISSGAHYQLSQDKSELLVTSGDREFRVPLGEKTAFSNGDQIELSAPVKQHDGEILVERSFANDLFSGHVSQNLRIGSKAHPLDPLSAEEITTAANAVKASKHWKDTIRFTQIRLADPSKEKVWEWSFGEGHDFSRQAIFTVVDGRKVYEGTVDLDSESVVAWKHIEDAHGMVTFDDFLAVQEIVSNSEAYKKALKKRGIENVENVVATPLTVGYFGGDDGLEHDLKLLKVVSYLDIGDGNYWAHPIENLVAVVDLEKKSILKIEDDGVIPVPMAPRPYDGRNQETIADVKPLMVVQPEGSNIAMSGNTIQWQNWNFHLKLNSRVGPVISTLTYNDQGEKRKIMYEGSLGGMIVPYGDPDVGWYFKSYLDSGDYGMGNLTSPLVGGVDTPNNATLLPATLVDNGGEPFTIPNAIAVFERYAGPEFKHTEMLGSSPGNESRERRELVVRWVSTIGNYDYMFDWIFMANGNIQLTVGASGIEAVKAVKSRTIHDETAEEDTRYGTLIDHNIVGTTHQHIYNFRLDMDVDGEQNNLKEINPVVAENTAGGPRKSVMITNERVVSTEQESVQKFDPSTVRLITNPNKENRMGYPVGYQIIPFAGGTHPIAKGALFSEDEWLFKRVSFMDKQIWVTQYKPEERYPEGKYPNRAKTDTGLKTFVSDNESIENVDTVLWMTTGATHVARAEEWPIMPTEYVHSMLKPWNFFDQTPTLNLPEQQTPEN
ncbi:primary-amine oxidase [Marinobacter sp. MA]|uniref:copper amine oxidase n=1 Tax=Marinobacter sp. MA TaxID=2971606 RepID=UPI003AAD6705